MTDEQPPILQALDTLAQATTGSALAVAHKTLRKGIRGARKRFQATFGPLAQTYIAAMEIWDTEKADGVPLAERIRHLEQTLRVAWPQTREWKYLCVSCDDVGLIWSSCAGDTTCGRHTPHLAHVFGRPCFCEKGLRFREKPKPTRDDFTAAGKSKPMARVGR